MGTDRCDQDPNWNMKERKRNLFKVRKWSFSFYFSSKSSLSEGNSSLEHAQWKIQVYVLVGLFWQFYRLFLKNNDSAKLFRWSVYHLSARDVHKPLAFHSPVCCLNFFLIFFYLFLFFFFVQWCLNQAISYLKIFWDTNVRTEC